MTLFETPIHEDWPHLIAKESCQSLLYVYTHFDYQDCLNGFLFSNRDMYFFLFISNLITVTPFQIYTNKASLADTKERIHLFTGQLDFTVKGRFFFHHLHRERLQEHFHRYLIGSLERYENRYGSTSDIIHHMNIYEKDFNGVL